MNSITRFDFTEFAIGGAAIDATGTPLPDATLDACHKADAVFLGAVAGPSGIASGWQTPESGLLALRQGPDSTLNVRP